MLVYQVVTVMLQKFDLLLLSTSVGKRGQTIA